MLAKMTTIPVISKLSNDSEAVRKRINRKKLKEKRRVDSFVSKYIQIKHPDIYAQIKDVYKTFVDRYPSRCDLTKTYFLKKWEKQANMQPSKLYMPHLPILKKVNQAAEPPREEILAESTSETPPREEILAESTSETPPREEILAESTSETPPPEEILSESTSETPPREEILAESTSETPPREGILAENMCETSPPGENLCSAMSLNDMAIAAEEIIRAIQSDRGFMDIVENFDVPTGVWDNELVLPDYVLEGDMDW